MPISAGILHQSLAVMTVACSEFEMGLGLGWPAPILNNAQKQHGELHLTPDQSSWVGSMEHSGRFLGVLAGSLLMNRLGRKPVLQVCPYLFLFSWLSTAFTTSAFILYLLRLTHGFAAGLNISTNSVYVGEVSSTKVRSFFGSITIAMGFIASFAEFIIAHYFSFTVTAVTNAFICTLLLLPSFWLTQPPAFLLLKGNTEKAMRNFLWLKGVTRTDEHMANEFKKLQDSVQTDNHISFWNKFMSPVNFKSIIIVSVIYLAMGAGGYYPVLSFASKIFMPTKALGQNQFIILFGALLLVSALSSIFISRRFERRRVLLTLLVLAVLAHTCTAVLYYVQLHVQRIPNFPLLIFGSVTAYGCMYTILFATSFLVRSELFPLSIKAPGTCIALAGFALASFAVTKSFHSISKHFGIYSNFLLFSIVNFVCAIFVYFVLPETKDLPLTDVHLRFQRIK